MGNSRKPSAPIKGKVHEMTPMTPEERKEQATRAYLQKRESIATGVLFNLMHNEEILKSNASPEDVADYAIAITDKVIEKLYFTPKEDKE